MFKIYRQIGLLRVIKYSFFGLWELIFKLLPYSPLRVWWLRLGGAKVGQNSVIEAIDFFNLDRTGLKGLSLGRDCYLGSGVLLDLAGTITLLNQVTISARTIVLSHLSVGFSDHPLLKQYPKKVSAVMFKSGCAVGVNSTIFPGVTVGSQSMVAAGSVVRQPVPDKVMVAGVPAEIKKRFNEKKS